MPTVETFSRIFQGIEANSTELGALRERVHRLEASSASSITSLGWLERTLWALIAAGALLEGKSIVFNERHLTREDLAEIRKGRKEWERRVAAESASAHKAPTLGGLGYFPGAAG